MGEHSHDYLRLLRRRAELSQRALGERIGGLDHGQISRMETGKRSISLDEARSWAEACGESLEFLTPREAAALKDLRALEEQRKVLLLHLLHAARWLKPEVWKLIAAQIEALID